MLKKILIAVFMMTLFITQNVSAQDVWIFTDDVGYEYYVESETLVNKTEYRLNRKFDVTVKLVNRDSSFDEKNYSFWENDAIVWYKVEGVEDVFTIAESKPAAAIWNYGLKILGIDYEISYE